ncbi:MAG: NACHT domain-containing protein [Parachlamydiaceae bacterium]|nr:NACHT domain-containing protein [Parachlamydiaceae bacterium]
MNSQFSTKSPLSPTTSPINKAIYNNKDKRQNLDAFALNESDKSFVSCVKKQAESVACLVLNHFLKQRTEGDWELTLPTPTLTQVVEHEFLERLGTQEVFGEQEPFHDEYAAGFGTAFLVGKNLAMTAAHCICEKDTKILDKKVIGATYIVFGFQNGKKLFADKQVYQIKKVISHQYTRIQDKNQNFTEWTDWALIELDRVTPYAPLIMNMTKKVANKVELYMLGHPSGLPVKFVGNGTIQRNQQKDFFETNLDAFGGNSGSPVFNRMTLEVEGMLCSGGEDYAITDNYRGTKKKRIQACQITSGRYGFEICQRLNMLRFLLDAHLIGMKEVDQQKNAKELIIHSLKEYYKSRNTIPRLLHKALPVDEIYTELVLLNKNDEENDKKEEEVGKNEEKKTFKEHRINSWEVIHAAKEPIELLELFNTKKKLLITKKKLLILGKAGIGKSTLCQYIAHQWAQGKLWEGEFDAIFWVPLRKLQYAHSGETIYSFLFRHCCQENSENLYANDIANYLKNSERVLFVLDGLDEVTLEENSLQKEIVDELLKFPYWILTSRPHAAGWIQADSTIENVGLASKSIDLYIQRSFNGNAQIVIQKIRQNPIIFGLCHIPINLELVCSILEKSKGDIALINSMTSLYERIIIELQRRFLEKIERPKPWEYEKGDLERDPEVSQIFTLLESIAWTGMQQNQLFFSFKKGKMKEIYYAYPPDEKRNELFTHACTSGFLQSTGENDQFLENDYSFLHLTFQEFFAARYLVRLLFVNSKEAAERIQEVKFNPRYKVVMWFTAGLLKNEGNDLKNLNVFFKIIDTPKDQIGFYASLLKIHCLEECGWPNKLKNLYTPEIKFWCQKMDFKSWLDSMVRHLIETLEISPRGVHDFLIPQLEYLLKHENWQVRVNAINVLGQLGHTKSSEILLLLIIALKDETQIPVCEAAIEALVELGYAQSEYVIDLLINTLIDRYIQHQKEIEIIITSQSYSKNGTSDISDISDISEKSVLLTKRKRQDRFSPVPSKLWLQIAVTEAFCKLGQTNPQIVLPLLIKNIDNENEWVKEAAKNAFERINQNQWKLPIRHSQKVDNNKKKKSPLLATLSDIYPQGIRPSFSELLTEIVCKIKKNEKSLATLEPDDESRSVKVGDEEIVNALMQISEKNPLLDSFDPKFLLSILLKMLNKSRDIDNTVSLALCQLAQAHPDIVFPVLGETLQDENKQIVLSSIEIISYIAVDNPEFNFPLFFIPLFLNASKNHLHGFWTLPTFRNILTRMSQNDPETVFNFFIKDLENTRRFNRREAIHILEELTPWNPEVAIPLLANALTDNPYWNARFYITKALKKYNLASYLRIYPNLLYQSYLESNPKKLHDFYEAKYQASLLASTPLSALITYYQEDPPTYALAITIKCIEENIAIVHKAQTICFYEQGMMREEPMQSEALFSEIENYTHQYPEFIAQHISLQPTLDYIEYSDQENCDNCCIIL